MPTNGVGARKKDKRSTTGDKSTGGKQRSKTVNAEMKKKLKEQTQAMAMASELVAGKRKTRMMQRPGRRGREEGESERLGRLLGLQEAKLESAKSNYCTF